jgi:hypothetical protein
MAMHSLTARVRKIGVLSKEKPTQKRQILKEHTIKSMIGRSLSTLKAEIKYISRNKIQADENS